MHQLAKAGQRKASTCACKAKANEMHLDAYGQQYERAKPPCPCKKRKGPESLEHQFQKRPCGTCRKCKFREGLQFEIAKQNAANRKCKCRTPQSGYRLQDFWDYDDMEYESPCGKKLSVVPPKDDTPKPKREPREKPKKKEKEIKAPKKKPRKDTSDEEEEEEEEEVEEEEGDEDDGRSARGGTPPTAESEEKIEESMDTGPVNPRESPSKSDSKSDEPGPSGGGRPAGRPRAKPPVVEKPPEDEKPSGGGKKRKSRAQSTVQEEEEPKKARKKAQPKPPPDCTVKKTKGCQKKCLPPQQGKKRMCKSKNKAKQEEADVS